MKAARRAVAGRPSIGAPVRQALVAAARAARSHAHAPYSHFRVGAAILDDQDRVHVGCNVENASYGLTVCAERNAIAAAVVGGARRIRAIAVVTPTKPPATPCGACRQALAEFGDEQTLVMLASPTGPATNRRLGSLLPESFRLSPT